MVLIICFFSADIDPLYDMFADLTHKKFSPDLDTVLTQSYQLGEYRQSLLLTQNCLGVLCGGK